MVQVASLFQSSEWREHSSEPRILGLLSRRLGIESLCGVLFSGTHPSYWAAFEGTFLRLKLDQFTATFCRVCFAESRQNLNKKGHKYFYISGNNFCLWPNIYLKDNKKSTFWSIPLLDQSRPFLLDPHLLGEIHHLEKTRNNENMTEGSQTQM